MSAVVVGGGLAGLIAARRFREAGVSPIVLESNVQLGGMIARAELGGVCVDGGAEAYATRSAAARELCDELGLPVAGPSGQPHVWWPEQIVALADGVLGIPGSLDDPALDVLSRDELNRLKEDLEMGPDIGADATTAGELMAARMGEAAVEKLMAPLVKGVYASAPERLPLAMFAPKLLPAMAEHGSLLAAVAAVRAPGSAAVEQPVGGMFTLIDALAKGVDVRTATPALKLRRAGSGFLVETPKERFEAARVVLCAPASVSRSLLADIGVTIPELPARPAPMALLASDHPGLDKHPVGSGVLMGQPEPSIVAKALTHYSAKWPWVRGMHVLRLSYPPTVNPTRAQAIADASALTKLQLDNHIEGFTTMTHPMPARIDPATRDEILATTAAAGVDVLGCWVDGNGIGPVIEAGARIV